MPQRRTPIYRQVYGVLERGIRSGRWKQGERLPSEAQLVRDFGASRITVGRAVRDLQLAGLVERHAGSGTYVRSRAAEPGRCSFGLLIPDLGETEIFEPICQGMMASPLAAEHALLWGSPGAAAGSKAERVWQLCRQYVERRVSGVFFAPLEFALDRDDLNARVVGALDQAGIPVVLLDRSTEPFPRRGPYDLVGLDNRHAAFTVTEHLLGLGVRRIAFWAVPHSASTVDAREAGYKEALTAFGVELERALVRRLDPDDVEAVRELMALRPQAVVCANDRTAARLMRTLGGMDLRVPRDVRLVGIDDTDYAAFLPTSLTTLRQPTRQIGAAALAAMLERVGGSELPTRDILLQGRLVVRQSCGAAGGAPGSASLTGAGGPSPNAP
jgi:GntR family transcriptional regulator, arabinose operon transcriptional repressor